MSQAMTGARAIFYLKDKAIAIAQNCSYTDTDQLQAVEVLGREVPAEHAELGRTIEFTVDTVRVFNKSATQLGLSTKLQDLLKQEALTASIVDKVSGAVVFMVTGVKKQTRTGTVNARGVWTESISFVGQIMMDSTDVQSPHSSTPAYPAGE